MSRAHNNRVQFHGGFDSLRQSTFDDGIKLEIVNIALTPPSKLGCPFRQCVRGRTARITISAAKRSA